MYIFIRPRGEVNKKEKTTLPRSIFLHEKHPTRVVLLFVTEESLVALDPPWVMLRSEKHY